MSTEATFHDHRGAELSAPELSGILRGSGLDGSSPRPL